LNHAEMLPTSANQCHNSTLVAIDENSRKTTEFAARSIPQLVDTVTQFFAK
jgi:hypothetical protein